MVLAICGCAVTAFVPAVANLSAFFLLHEDRWLLIAQAFVGFLAYRELTDRANPLQLRRGVVAASVLLVIAICYLGHFLILSGYDMSRDEQMAVFDSRVFAMGRRVASLPMLWRDHASALNTMFMAPVVHPIGWISAYLPVNALLRSLIGLVADPALTGPLLTGIGALALVNCVRLLWPDDKEATIVALALYLTSGQILLAGMSAYAMPAHLAFNLVWLWLFLLKRYTADCGALLIGFTATGLHQPIFHPLFVAPFFFLLLREKSWARLGLYCMGYAVICAFWLAWPSWTYPLIAGHQAESAAAAGGYWFKLKQLLLDGDNGRWFNMSANLLRFLAWQNLLLLPLAITGGLLWRNHLIRAMLASILLPVVVMLLIMPYQGHGFGYRYLHGVIGSVILLAVYGWRSIVAEHSALRLFFLRTTMMTTIFIVPAQFWMAHGLHSAFASVNQRIANSGMDYIIIGEADAPFTADLVLNRPDLSNRPLRLLSEGLDRPLMSEICRTHPIIGLPAGRLFNPIAATFHTRPVTVADERIARLSPSLVAAGCTVTIID